MKTLALAVIGIAAALLSASVDAQAFRGTALVITSPANGTVVAPGQTISVSVAVHSGTYPAGIGIVGGQDSGTMVIAGPLSGSSLTFSVAIPKDATPGPLGISATGADSSGTLDVSAEVTLVVERTDTPVSLRVDPPSMHFQHVGQSFPLNVVGVYADGSWHGLTRSSLLQLSSGNTTIATVTDNSVKAVSPGNTDIRVSYRGLTVSVPIYVRPCAVCR